MNKDKLKELLALQEERKELCQLAEALWDDGWKDWEEEGEVIVGFSKDYSSYTEPIDMDWAEALMLGHTSCLNEICKYLTKILKARTGIVVNTISVLIDITNIANTSVVLRFNE